MADRSTVSFRQAMSSAAFVIVAILAAETNGQCNGTTRVFTATNDSNIIPPPYNSSRLYPRSANCSWLLETTPFKIISVSIYYLTLGNNCNSTRLEIFDGDSMTSPRLAILCGSIIIYQQFNSSGPSALISFTSNETGALDSFYIFYNAQDSRDSLTTTTRLPWWWLMTTAAPITSTTTTTTTPNPACVAGSYTTLYASTSAAYLTSPNYYNANIVYNNCRWRINSVYDTLKIVVNNLYTGYNGCTNNYYLDIFDGGSSSSPRLARLCGSIAYQTYKSSGYSLFLSFSASDGILFALQYGFSLEYSAQPASTTTSAMPWRMTTTTTVTSTRSPISPTRLTASRDYSLYFTSPYFRSPYPADANYAWLLQTESVGYTVMLVVETLRLENSSNCIYDRLEIFDGATAYSPRLAVLCGEMYYRTFYSSGSTAFVSFTSDSFIQDIGFSITYRAVWNTTTATQLPWWTTTSLTTSGGSTSSKCIERGYGGVNLDAEYLNENYIEFPNYMFYDYFYPNNADCAWRLLAGMDYVIHVRVIKMDIEYQEACGFDSVTLYDASWALNTSKIAKLCTYLSSTLDYYSNGNNMYITFTSDGSTTKTGFRLMYEAVRPSDVPPWSASSHTSSHISVIVGAVVGVVAGVAIIVVICVLIIRCNRKSRRACGSQAARRPPAAPLTERAQAPPPYTTVSSQFVCGGVVFGSRNGPPAIGARPHSGYSNLGYADTEGHGPPPAYTDLLILGHILPPANSGSVPAVPSAPLYTVSADPRGAAGGSDTASLDPKSVSFPSPPSYDDVIRVTGASPPPRPLPPLPLTASASSVTVVQPLVR